MAQSGMARHGSDMAQVDSIGSIAWHSRRRGQQQHHHQQRNDPGPCHARSLKSPMQRGGAWKPGSAIAGGRSPRRDCEQEARISGLPRRRWVLGRSSRLDSPAATTTTTTTRTKGDPSWRPVQARRRPFSSISIVILPHLIANNVSPATLTKQRSWGFGRTRGVPKGAPAFCPHATQPDSPAQYVGNGLRRCRQGSKKWLNGFLTKRAVQITLLAPRYGDWWSPSRRLALYLL